MKLDFLAGEPQFMDHLAPVWHALAPESRGTFHVQPSTEMFEHARSLGLSASGAVPAGPDPVLVASWGDTKRVSALGRRYIARIEHGIGQTYAGDPESDLVTHPSYPGGDGAEAVGLFLVPNEHAGSRWRARYPGAQVEIIGCPKLDTPVSFSPEYPPIVAVSFHWDWYMLPETRSAFAQYRDAVVGLAHECEYQLVGHAHPKAAPLLSRWFDRNAITYVEDFAQVLSMASLFICDNSSAIYEFAATGRPVVVLNRRAEGGDPGFRREVNHGLRFWEASGVGINVDRPRDLSDAVLRALDDPEDVKAEREKALDIVYAVRRGAAKLAAGALEAWMARLPVASRSLSPRQERVAAFRAAQ